MEKQYDKSQEKVRKLRIVYDRNKFNVEDILQEKKNSLYKKYNT